MNASRSTPRKVLAKASELGVHPDCVAADYSGACDECIEIFNQVFHEFYGHASDAGEALELIVKDILKDRGIE